jgi:hypothetical protein
MKPFLHIIRWGLALLLLGLAARCTVSRAALPPTPPETPGAAEEPASEKTPSQKTAPGKTAPSQTAGSQTPQPTNPGETSDPSAAEASPAHLKGVIHPARSDSSIISLRSGPSTRESAVGALPDRAIVEVTGRSPQGDWWRVRAAGVEGWVFFQDIRLSRAALAAPCIAPPDSDCPPEPAAPLAEMMEEADETAGVENTAGMEETPDAEEMADAEKTARDFLASPAANPAALPLSFAGVIENPDANQRETYRFNDAFGGEIWVDAAAQRVVRWTREDLPAPGEAQPFNALRSGAQTFAELNSPAFYERPGTLTASEPVADSGANAVAGANAADAYAFRWEAAGMPNDAAGFPTPYLLVVLRGDGQILSYFNTLDLFAE